MLPAWRLLGASVTGTWHVKGGRAGQDAHGYREVSGGVLLAVADGASSAERSAEGAHLAAAGILDAVASTLASGWPASLQVWRNVFSDAYATAKRSLEQLAADEALPARAFATTLLCAALSDEVLAVAQLGDGVAAAFSPGGGHGRGAGGDWFLAAEPQRGEYANETYFLSQAGALQHLDIYVYAEPVRALALMTDGLLRLVIDAKRLPHVPFFQPLLTFGVEMEDQTLAEAQLAAFLASERVCARTDDDKTIVMALRLPPGGDP
jgi:hypothetical protein